MDILTRLFWVAFLVFLNGFFVAAEFALVRVRTTRLRELAQHADPRVGWARRVVGNIDAMLSATQLGITFASLALGWIGEPFVADLLHEPLAWLGITKPAIVHGISFAVAFGLLSFLHIVFGEQAPKSLAIRRADGTALNTSGPLLLFYYVFYPAIWLLNNAAILVLRMIGIDTTATERAHSPEEISYIVEQAHRGGTLDARERRLVEQALRFSRRLAREVMVPRGRIIYLTTRRPLAENLAIARESMYARFPVCDPDLDHVVGYAHIRELHNRVLENEDVGVLLQVRRPVPFVPGAAPLDDVLHQLRAEKSHMAIVVDEYGGTAGLLTLEDLIEEIVGEIQDEFDEEAPLLRKEAAGAWFVDGGATVEEVNAALGLALDAEHGTTVGGWVVARLGHIPERGESLRVGPYRATVAQVAEHRVTLLHFRRLSAAGAKEPEATPAPRP
jgi:CBS domain containing-hemolysin-like protein